jgi:threonine dehydrogenase-like Zn-dependent dehydrogenase
MRTVVVTGPGQIEVQDAPDPELPDTESAIVEMESTAICGSDLHFYDGDLPMFPVAAGHEIVGRIVEVGSDVRRFSLGQRVLVSSVAGCGKCVGCADGDPVTCLAGGKVFGAGELGGAQSDLLAVPAADFNLLAIPDGIDDEAALLLTDNLGTGWVAAQRTDLAPGGTVVVLGLGAVGLCAVRSALLLGAGRVLAVDPVAGRRDRAVASGAIAIEDDDVAAAVLEATGGRGPSRRDHFGSGRPRP